MSDFKDMEKSKRTRRVSRFCTSWDEWAYASYLYQLFVVDVHPKPCVRFRGGKLTSRLGLCKNPSQHLGMRLRFSLEMGNSFAMVRHVEHVVEV